MEWELIKQILEMGGVVVLAIIIGYVRHSSAQSVDYSVWNSRR